MDTHRLHFQTLIDYVRERHANRATETDYPTVEWRGDAFLTLVRDAYGNVELKSKSCNFIVLDDEKAHELRVVEGDWGAVAKAIEMVED